MSMHTLPAILRAAVRQAAGDLRPSILGTGAFSLLIAVLPVIVVGMLGSDSGNAGTAFGPMLVAGSIGAFGCFIVLQIAGEMYTDRVGGALLRVRILPHPGVGDRQDDIHHHDVRHHPGGRAHRNRPH